MKSRSSRSAAVLLALGVGLLTLPAEALAVVRADGAAPAGGPRPGVMQRAVMIRYTPLQVFGGSGVLVGPRHVLTAAHAAEGWPPAMLTIDLANKANTRVAVARVTRHPDKKIDLAMLRLAEPVNAEPITLPRRAPRVGQRVWLGGYGVYGAPGNPRGLGAFHAGFNRIARIKNGRGVITLDRDTGGPENPNEPEALPAAFDSGSPVWVETESGWALAGVTVTATGREGPDYGDRSSHQLLAPVKDWLRSVIGLNQIKTAE